jgi:hypothetical protein
MEYEIGGDGVDNSNQIEIYLNNKRVRDIRLLELDDLVQLLDTLE